MDNDELEFLYNTRLRGTSLSTDFQRRLSAALLSDFQRETESDEEIDSSKDDDDRDGDFLPEDDASDIEDDVNIEPNEIFDSDEDIEEDKEEGAEVDDVVEVKPNVGHDRFMYGRDGTKWSKAEPALPCRIRQQNNDKRFRPGPKTKLLMPREVFKLIFSPTIPFIIITETNRHAREAVRKWNEQHPNSKQREWIDLTSTELDAFIGILLASGAARNNMYASKLLWRSDALPIFCAAMSHKRFVTLSRYIRFDDSRTRALRLQTDKAAPIRQIWNSLNQNLAKYYEAHENVIVDEQLFPYRGRTKFTQYIPSKPVKYGIKVWWACDSKTKFPLQGKLYTGGDEGGALPEVKQGENVLLDFAKRYKNAGRTIIADDFFTTVEGAQQLAAKGIGFVGNIRSNKRFLPNEMKKSNGRPVFSSIFGFLDNRVSLCSYVPKKNRAVNVISTVHFTKKVEGVAKKPEAISFYNSTKLAGVDSVDQILTQYTTRRPTRRWTLAFFYNIIDVIALAAYTICKENEGCTRTDGRRTFLDTLSNTVVRANIENRMNTPHNLAQFKTRLAFESFFGRAINPRETHIVPQRIDPNTHTGRRDCRICLTQEDKLRRKTRFFCIKCTNAVCLQHSKVDYICFSCTPRNS